MTGFIYAITCDGLVKIGWSMKPRERFSQIKAYNRAPCLFVGLVAGSKDLESEIHRKFNDWRDHGEWFRLEGPVAEFVSSLPPPDMRRSPRPCVIADARAKLSVSQAGLAGLIGVTQATVSRWESKRAVMPIYAEKLLARIIAERTADKGKAA